MSAVTSDATTSVNQPLDSIRVLELGSTAAGPFCGRLLADFGAEVVKIELGTGDPIRALGETVHGKSLYAASICRNKLIASVDLRSKKGRELVLSMIPHFDVVVENFRPGTLEKWSLGWEQLQKLRPDLILTRISGFGQTGPYRHKPGYGVIGEAMSGLRRMIGDPDRPPSRVAIPLTDYIAGLYAAFGTVMALSVRDRTGQGQMVDVSLIDSAFSFMESFVPAFEKTGREGMRAGPRLPDSAPNTLFPTHDGQHIHIAAFADAVFRRLAGAMGRPELSMDTRFSTQAARNLHETELEALIAEWTGAHPLEHLQRVLDANGVPASRIFSMADIFEDEHFRARNMLVSTPDDDLGSVTLAGIVPKFSATPGSLRWSGHRTGQDTRTVIKRFVGIDDAQLDALVAEGVISCDPTKPVTEAPASSRTTPA